MTIPSATGGTPDNLPSEAPDSGHQPTVDVPCPTIDPERLACISEGDREFELELLEAYIEDSLYCISSIDTATQTSDWGTVSAYAHQLKGASSNIGAKAMQDLCAQLEREAKAQSCSNTIDSLRKALEDVKETVKQW